MVDKECTCHISLEGCFYIDIYLNSFGKEVRVANLDIPHQLKFTPEWFQEWLSDEADEWYKDL